MLRPGPLTKPSQRPGPLRLHPGAGSLKSRIYGIAKRAGLFDPAMRAYPLWQALLFQHISHPGQTAFVIMVRTNLETFWKSNRYHILRQIVFVDRKLSSSFYLLSKPLLRIIVNILEIICMFTWPIRICSALCVKICIRRRNTIRRHH